MKNHETAHEVNVGARLREMRTGRGLSIRGLAEKSGLNFNTLSLIENGKTSPSVSTLQQIATALEIPIAAFFETRTPIQRIVYQQEGDRQSAAFANGLLADLGAGFSNQSVELFLVALEPKAHSGREAIVHTGVELVYCLEGWLEYEVEQETFTLHPGDSLVFEAHLPHRWRNAGEIPSRSLLLLCPADERDHPNERHFTPAEA